MAMILSPKLRVIVSQLHKQAVKAGPQMTDNPVWEMGERVAEVKVLLDDHVVGGKHSAADVMAKTQAVLSGA